MGDTAIPVKNEAYVFEIALVSQADTKLYQTNPTLAAGDVKVQTDDGSLANITTLPTGAASSKRVKVSLSASEMNGDNVWVQFSDAAGAEWCDFAVCIQTAARGVDDLAYPATTGRSLAVDASGQVDVRALAAGCVTAAAIATGAIDADAIAVDGANEIADALLDRASVADGYTVRQAIRVLLADAAGKSSGSESNAPVIRAADDSKARITATVDANGNRTAVTIDAT